MASLRCPLPELPIFGIGCLPVYKVCYLHSRVDAPVLTVYQLIRSAAYTQRVDAPVVTVYQLIRSAVYTQELMLRH